MMDLENIGIQHNTTGCAELSALSSTNCSLSGLEIGSHYQMRTKIGEGCYVFPSLEAALVLCVWSGVICVS